MAKFVLMALGCAISSGVVWLFPKIPLVTSLGLFAISLGLLLWIWWWYVKQVSTTLTIYKDAGDKIMLLYDRAQASADSREQVHDPITEFPTLTADVSGLDVTFARSMFYRLPLPKWVVNLSAGRINFTRAGTDDPTFWLAFVANPYGIIKWLTEVRKTAAKVEATVEERKAEEREVEIVARGVTEALNKLRAKSTA